MRRNRWCVPILLHLRQLPLAKGNVRPFGSRCESDSRALTRVFGHWFRHWQVGSQAPNRHTKVNGQSP
jgi:hypothetical protein